MKIHIEQLNLEIFGGCNFACECCPQSEGRPKEFLKKLPFGVFEKIVADAMQYGVQSVSLHGSGEPTIHPELIRMVRYVRDHGMRPSFFTNGYLLRPELFQELIDAGIDVITVSVLGADKEAYKGIMRKKGVKPGEEELVYETICENLAGCKAVMDRNPGKGVFHIRSLIFSDPRDEEKKKAEIRAYRENWIDPFDALGEIWLTHNWTGQYNGTYDRMSLASDKTLRSCGRPFAETLEVRAGGLGNHYGAVVPCPFVLGKWEPHAVLGHLDTETIAEVRTGEPLRRLREAHEGESPRFSDIPYCKNETHAFGLDNHTCEMLIKTDQALAWSNIPGRHEGQSKTSEVDYLLASAQHSSAGRTEQLVQLTVRKPATV